MWSFGVGRSTEGTRRRGVGSIRSLEYVEEEPADHPAVKRALPVSKERGSTPLPNVPDRVLSDIAHLLVSESAPDLVLEAIAGPSPSWSPTTP
jgi:hypothetical protein